MRLSDGRSEINSCLKISDTQQVGNCLWPAEVEESEEERENNSFHPRRRR